VKDARHYGEKSSEARGQARQGVGETRRLDATDSPCLPLSLSPRLRRVHVDYPRVRSPGSNAAT
jgi:DNA-binding transcriptional LysR family regulator